MKNVLKPCVLSVCLFGAGFISAMNRYATQLVKMGITSHSPIMCKNQMTFALSKTIPYTRLNSTSLKSSYAFNGSINRTLLSQGDHQSAVSSMHNPFVYTLKRIWGDLYEIIVTDAYGEIIGEQSFSLEKSYLNHIYVNSKFRNQGIAVELLKKALLCIYHKSIEKSDVFFTARPFRDTHMDLDTLIQLYVKKGAVLVSKDSHFAQMKFTKEFIENLALQNPDSFLVQEKGLITFSLNTIWSNWKKNIIDATLL